MRGGGRDDSLYWFGEVYSLLLAFYILDEETCIALSVDEYRYEKSFPVPASTVNRLKSFEDVVNPIVLCIMWYF